MSDSHGFSRGWVRFTRSSVLLFVPVFLVISSVFLILISAKAWIPIEYRMPGFPEDEYGFTTDDRIYWSAVDINYLLGDHDIDYYDQFILDDGSPMHNSRELQHLEDVETVLEGARLVWWLGLLLIVGGTTIIWRVVGLSAALVMLKQGGLWMIVVIGVVAVLIAVAFEFLFVGFHELLFDPGTWTFPFSDTFIRLYPERFWRDTFALVAGISVLLGGLVTLIPHWILKRRQAH